MNSEVLRDMESSNSFLLKQKERQNKLESEVMEKGGAALAFMSHPFWVIFDKDLEKLRTDLNARLLKSDSLEKEEMDKLIWSINMIDLFRTEPKGYVEKMKLLLNRKQK